MISKPVFVPKSKITQNHFHKINERVLALKLVDKTKISIEKFNICAKNITL